MSKNNLSDLDDISKLDSIKKRKKFKTLNISAELRIFDLYNFIKEIFVSLRTYLILFISLFDIAEVEYIFFSNSVYKK